MTMLMLIEWNFSCLYDDLWKWDWTISVCLPNSCLEQSAVLSVIKLATRMYEWTEMWARAMNEYRLSRQPEIWWVESSGGAAMHTLWTISKHLIVRVVCICDSLSYHIRWEVCTWKKMSNSFLGVGPCNCCSSFLYMILNSPECGAPIRLIWSFLLPYIDHLRHQWSNIINPQWAASLLVTLFQGKYIDRLVNKVNVRVQTFSAVVLKLFRSASSLAACRWNLPTVPWIILRTSSKTRSWGEQ